MLQIVGSLVLVAALVAVGASGKSAAVPLSPQELPENVAVVVSSVPRSLGTITKAEVQRALVQEAARAGLDSLPKPGSDRYERLENDTLGNRLDSVWLQGQGPEMGIVVTHSQIVRKRKRLVKGGFENQAAYRRYLKERHLTPRDVNEQVKILLLTNRVLRRVFQGASSEFEEQEAFHEFIEAYDERWRGRTFCAPAYVTDRCSNGPPPPDSA